MYFYYSKEEDIFFFKSSAETKETSSMICMEINPKNVPSLFLQIQNVTLPK